jgi:MarR family transcriptional regulator, organic hydroperoxide resistance regulator
MLKTTFAKAEDSPGFLLWKAANLLQRSHTRCLKGLGVTPTQFSVMTCLVYLHGLQAGERGEPVTQAAISAHAGLDKMLVSDLIKTLTSKKLVRKRRHPTDGRAFLLEPTPAGIRITNSAVQAVEATDTEFFGGVEDLGRLHRALLTLIGK